jgi:hypothetical protein
MNPPRQDARPKNMVIDVRGSHARLLFALRLGLARHRVLQHVTGFMVWPFSNCQTMRICPAPLDSEENLNASMK